MCFFVPQSIYRNILKNGSSFQRDLAVQNLRGIKALTRQQVSSYLRGLLSTERQTLDPHLEADRETKKRSVFDAKNKHTVPGTLVREEGAKPIGDKEADKAYDDAGTTWDFFHKIYNRNSIDDKGMELLLTVHYGKNYGNAFWNGKNMVFGDGDGQIFQSFVILDVVGHELSHGVTEHTAHLVYRKQPGALNESFSDVFGSMIKQYKLNQTAEQADWLIGEGLFTSQINGKALRSMSAPGTAYNDPIIGKDRQPDHMDRYNSSPEDNYGVHINSGIPNKAFYTTSMLIGGYSWEKAGKIWYQTLSKELSSNSQFQDCANATLKVASELYGKGSKESKAVREGWAAVGIKV